MLVRKIFSVLTNRSGKRRKTTSCFMWGLSEQLETRMVPATLSVISQSGMSTYDASYLRSTDNPSGTTHRMQVETEGVKAVGEDEIQGSTIGTNVGGTVSHYETIAGEIDATDDGRISWGETSSFPVVSGFTKVTARKIIPEPASRFSASASADVAVVPERLTVNEHFTGISVASSAQFTISYQVTSGGEIFGDRAVLHVDVFNFDHGGISSVTIAGAATGPGDFLVSVGDTITLTFSANSFLTNVDAVSRSSARSDVSAWTSASVELRALDLVPADASVTDAHFTGANDLPTSKFEFEWAYRGDSQSSEADSFTATLYYSADRIFDSSDLQTGQPFPLLADQEFDSGTAVFDFGTKKPLKPIRDRPFLLVVLAGVEGEANLTNNVKAISLPYIDILSVTAESQVGKKREWVNTLMQESTFELDVSPVLTFAWHGIEYRRLDSPLSGEHIEWTRLAESTTDTVYGVHRLTGLFEYRAVVDVDGATFTSEHYSGLKKPAKRPRIQVLFPTGTEIGDDPSVKARANSLWREADALAIESNLTSKYEVTTWLYLDSATGEYSIQEPVFHGPTPMLNGRAQGHLLDPLPFIDVFDNESHSAKYLVAHLHTHPREDPQNLPDRATTVRTVGASTEKGASDEATFQLLPKAIRKELPGLVYDYIGKRYEDVAANPTDPQFIGKRIIFSGYNYDAEAAEPDNGKLYVYSWERRRDLKKRVK